jgi:hypothetical protein
VDLVYAYSVFSHLAEEAHQAWMSEFHRILKTGGLLVVTTQRRAFIDFCASLRKRRRRAIIGFLRRLMRGDRQEPSHAWYEGLAASFSDVRATKRAYDEGRFVYAPTGGGAVRDASFYGEAVVSPRYVERTWANRFELIDFVDDRSRSDQAIIVARRRQSGV